jgi:beta-glucanase (GH16 family)
MLRIKVGNICFSIVSVAALLTATSIAGQTASKTAAPAKAKLVWADEFNGAEGSGPDVKKWITIEDGSGFGNNELEYYTPRAVNVHVEKGKLLLTARKEPYTGKNGAKEYTSGRIESRGKFELQYGRVEARLKLPKGQGIWPAFWMLGTDFATESWPACGEIDIMENIGSEPDKVHGSLHGPGYSGGNPLGGVYTLPDGKRFSDDYHVFALEWEPKEIRFYVDGNLYETQKAAELPTGKRWVFDHPFFIVLNIAVGGFWPGVPDAATSFPQTMAVDWVRVYKLGL